MSNPFQKDLAENEIGRLAEDQKAAVKRMFKARRLTGWGIALLDGLFALPAVALALRAVDAINFAVLGSAALALVALAAYGAAMVYTSRAAERSALAAEVKTVSGIPIKYDYTVPIKVPGPSNLPITHFLRLKNGWLKIEGVSYGVLPSSLYQEISGEKSATFYYIPAGGVGFKKRLIVNFLP